MSVVVRQFLMVKADKKRSGALFGRRALKMIDSTRSRAGS
jgi:hypothetical protein